MMFERAIAALCDSEVEFVVVGGLSANLHGSAYVTFDLDLSYSRRAENLKRLASALAPFHPRPRGFPLDLPFVWDHRTLINGTVFTLNTDLGAIDLLAEIAGVGDFDSVQEHSVEVELYGRTVRTLSLPALIRAKRAAGRPKDIGVLHELESLLSAQESS